MWAIDDVDDFKILPVCCAYRFQFRNELSMHLCMTGKKVELMNDGREKRTAIRVYGRFSRDSALLL